jgi:hypothetical protein
MAIGASGPPFDLFRFNLGIFDPMMEDGDQRADEGIDDLL